MTLCKAEKNRCCITLVLILAFFGVYGQKNVTAAGGNAGGAGGSVSYSVGQLDYKASVGASGSVNQGVQQPYEIFVIHTTDQPETMKNEISLSPNPTASGVKLSYAGDETGALGYTLSDELGRILERRVLTAVSEQIDMSLYRNGNYFLTVTSNGHSVKQFKIIKTQ